MAPVTIWGSDTTRSDLIKASCAELGVPFDFVALDWNAKEHKSEAFLKINPCGQTPAFRDGDLTLTESGAIMLYLADKYGGAGPLGCDTPERRAVLARWLFFANATLCPDLAAKSGRSCDVLEAKLATQAYVCGAEFTLVDVAVATYLAWMPYWAKADPEWTLAARWPRLAEYVARVMARPAVGPNVPLAWLDDTAAWLL